MGVGRHSLRAGRATRFERGECLASSGACNSLRAGRASRFERGEQLASGGACFSLRAGRASRFGRGGQDEFGLTDITLSLSASSLPQANLVKNIDGSRIR